MLRDWLPVLLYLLLCVGFAGGTILLSRLIGRQRPSREKLMPYECGMDPIGTARKRFTVWFYLVAMAFLIFDLEAAFLWPWAVAFRELGMFGFVEALVFVAVLLLGLVYLWRRGGLEWE